MAVDLNTVKNIASGKTSTQSASPEAITTPYIIDPTLWYQALPYRFLLNKNNGQKISINLPIAPNNLQISTRMATTVIPTLYGIVEDHSDVRFYDIVIQGTTGIAPKYVGMEQNGGNAQPKVGRTSFSASEMTDLGGFLPEITNMVKQAKKIYEEVSGTEAANKSGISSYNTGYYAFHQLYSFFLLYKQECVSGLNQSSGSKSNGLQDASASLGATLGSVFGGGSSYGAAVKTSPQAAPVSVPVREGHPLQFFNYKDNQMYDVVPVGFTLVRSAENPMLYNYSIKLTAFNLRSSNSKIKFTGKDGKDIGFQGAFAQQMGLDGLDGSLFSKTANVARTVSTALSRIGITR
jgi:hypothetical protein